MEFLPQLQEFLKLNGFIYTVRKYEMDQRLVSVEDLGYCLRTPLGIVENKEQLEPYVKDSGFTSVETWWTKIREFIPNKVDKLYLYKVEGRREEWKKQL